MSDVTLGWKMTIHPDRVEVVIPAGHWEHVSGLPELASGLPRFQDDIDKMAERLKCHLAALVARRLGLQFMDGKI